jgi:hypothetical protein
MAEVKSSAIMRISMLSYEEACEWFSYDPQTGDIKWIKRSSNRCKSSCAGSMNALGYVNIKLRGDNFYAHRIAWLLMTGQWPSTHVDHIDGRRSNNRWSNLRAATHGENLINAKVYSNNTSGFKGVYRDKRSGKFHAHGSIDGRKIHLGSFDTPEAAQAAYVAFSSEQFGAEFVRTK